ncbi:MAG: hypothetical protein ACTSRP_09955 [Candidatus Helarchaeota archaeon]
MSDIKLNKLEISTKLKNQLLNIPNFNRLSKSPYKLLENILRKSYKHLINIHLTKSQLKTEIIKSIITIFIDNRVFIRLNRDKTLSKTAIDRIIDEISNKLISIREQYNKKQLKDILELIICQFYKISI